ncbi:MAG TPA: hypothetical protein VJN44_09460 [Roseateles sp.]|nr:hypothetical protein [Roseateles sp.]
MGQPWGETQVEALGRLDRAEPIFHLVALHENERRGCVRVGGIFLLQRPLCG